MPELPELTALVSLLRPRLVGKTVAAGDLLAFSALKTIAPPLEALAGLEITGVDRYGKFVAVNCDGVHLVFHLARAGWVTWYETLPPGGRRPGKSAVALRIELHDGSGFALTEAGTQKHLAIFVVEDPSQIPAIAALGPDPLAESFTVASFGRLLQRAQRAQIKGVLRDQKLLAGLGNAYSDEVLYAAKISPFKPAASLSPDEVERTFESLQQVLRQAIDACSGRDLHQLKDAKRSTLVVHGRAGQLCPRCSRAIAEVSFADSSLQYCPGCQTGGKALADRRMSKLLK